jgi:hypothetical protein
MARRKYKAKKTRRSRKKTGVSIIGLAETGVLLDVASRAAFNTGIVEFTTGNMASGSTSITLKELISPQGRFYANPGKGLSGPMSYIGNNLKKNWLGAAGMMIAVPILFKFGKQLGRPMISKTNRLLNKAGVGSTVKL